MMKLLGRILMFLALAAAPARAAAPPPAARAVDVLEHLGQPIDRTLEFTRPDGARVKLADYLSGDKPSLLVLAYYRCPMLCGLVLRGVAAGLKDLDYRLGRDYRVITVSVDPRDTPEAATEKQLNAISGVDQPDARSAWPFLVGKEPAIKALADELGFKFAYDPRTDQYAHPAVVFALTPDGHISRYLYGVHFPPRDLRLALVEAGLGKTGSVVDRILLTCYQYDPASRRYGPYIFGFIRLGGAVILLVVGGLVGGLWVGERRRRRAFLASGGGQPR